MKNINQTIFNNPLFLKLLPSIFIGVLVLSLPFVAVASYESATHWSCPAGYTALDLYGRVIPASQLVTTAFNIQRNVGMMIARCEKYTTGFAGRVLSTYSLEGYSTVNTASAGIIKTTHYFYVNSPFLYLENLPKSKVSVGIESTLNKYSPKPSFNIKNGWNLIPKNNKITVSGKEQNNLFYELALNTINLNRNGRNFSSKEEVISFLQNSDFFEKLGFSAAEKKNSLDYFIPKIQSAENKKYYYLSILDADAIKNISTLHIDPQPTTVVRVYYSLYPTDVPVKTEGDILFPEIIKGNNKDFLAKETGEILVYPDMIVIWNKNK